MFANAGDAVAVGVEFVGVDVVGDVAGEFGRDGVGADGLAFGGAVAVEAVGGDEGEEEEGGAEVELHG